MSASEAALAQRAREILQGSVALDATWTTSLTDDLLAKVRAGGVSALHVTTCVHESFRGTTDRIVGWLETIDKYSQDLTLARSVLEIEKAHRDGKVAVVLAFQNATPIEDDARYLMLFKELGVRTIQITYNERNLLGDGCTERQNTGLSDFGVLVIQEMNRLGLLVDISHVGEATAGEAIEVSSAPVVATHANARALCDGPRNLSDETLKAIGAKGGVVGINSFPGFVSKKDGKDQTVDDFLNHVDYVATFMGVDKVGIGLDLIEGKSKAYYTTSDGRLGMGRYPYKPGAYPPWPWIYPIPSIASYPDIVEGLLRRGYSEDQVIGVIGGNFLRVFRQVWGS